MTLVSVWITTYNHEAYISEALDNVLNQKVNFDYEIVLGEDCSTDSTRKIVKAYKQKYPDKIRLFLPDKNLGMLPMFKESYALCTGKYIAWLDGDDYWTDPNKLQKQVDFMEANPDYVMCFHKTTILKQILNTRNESSDPEHLLPDSTMTSAEFLNLHNPVHSSSVLHRNILGRSLPDDFYTIPYSDWAFYFMLLQHGKAKYLHDNMGVYRIHGGGAWSGQDKKMQYYSLIDFYKKLQVFFDYLPVKKSNQLIADQYKRVIRLEIKDKSIKGVLHDLIEIIRYDPGLILRMTGLKLSGRRTGPK